MGSRILIAGGVGLVGVGLWSATGPVDGFTWFLEAVPVAIVLVLLAATRRRFPLTPLAYGLIAVHAVVLLVGARWSYAEVPLGFWLQDLLGWQRNPYDRIGHLAQGFVPAIVVRELLRRHTPLGPGWWLLTIVTLCCLGISAFYELIEWWVAAATGSAAEAFLGTQGDVWDTQWDMACALVGALVAQLALARLHERQLQRLERGDPG